MAWDPFAVLGLPRRFDLNRAVIERAYLARAAEVHPDLLQAGSAAIEGQEEPAAAELNRARQDVSDPETRANVLLALLGGPAKEAERSLPEGFLMEMMEVREQMEAAKASGDAEAIRRFERWADQQRSGHVQSVGELFAGLGEAPDAGKLRAIRTRLNAWRYIERMLEQVG